MIDRLATRGGILVASLALLSCGEDPSQPPTAEPPDDPFYAAVADELAALSHPSVSEEDRAADWEVLTAILELFETSEVGG